jgi:hypothetical protein
VTVNGDQPCMKPRARTRKLWAAAQLQTSTTSCCVLGAQVQTFWTVRSSAQLVNAYRPSGTPAGKPGSVALSGFPTSVAAKSQNGPLTS